MYIFFNVANELLKQYTLNTEMFINYGCGIRISDLDEELCKWGASIPSSVLERKPRSLSVHNNWKVSEHKEFFLNSALILFDEFLQEIHMKGLEQFIRLIDISFQPWLSQNDLDELHSAALRF